MTYFIKKTKQNKQTETSICFDSGGLYYADLLLLILPMTDTAYFISDKQIELNIENKVSPHC